MFRRFTIITLGILLGIGTAVAAEGPTFEQLDKELTTFKPHAKLVGEANAHLGQDGLPFYCMFDLFLTVMNDPEHPKHGETKAAWDANQAKFNEQAGMIANVMGKNLMPLMVTSSQAFAEGFKKGAAAYAPDFEPADYARPGAMTVGEGDGAHEVAWFKGMADANGDGTSNSDALSAIAPGWAPTKGEDGIVTDPGKGVSQDQREQFVQGALNKEEK